MVMIFKTHQFSDFDLYITDVMNTVHTAAETNDTQFFNYAAALEDALHPQNAYSGTFFTFQS